MVRAVGLEPTRHKHTPLKRACLPIPACSHTASTNDIIALTSSFVNNFFQKKQKKLKTLKSKVFRLFYKDETEKVLVFKDKFTSYIKQELTNIKKGDTFAFKNKNNFDNSYTCDFFSSDSGAESFFI